MTSDGSDDTGETGDEEACSHCKYTKRTGDFTSRNGGWTREGMDLFNDLYKKEKEDRQSDNGAFAKVYREHRVCLCMGIKGKEGLPMGLGISRQYATTLMTCGLLQLPI